MPALPHPQSPAGAASGQIPRGARGQGSPGDAVHGLEAQENRAGQREVTQHIGISGSSPSGQKAGTHIPCPHP